MANAPQLTVGLGFDLDEASAKKVVKGMEQLNNHLEGSAETASKKVSGSWVNGLGNMLKGFIAFEVATRGFQFTKDLFLLEEKFRSMQLPLKNLTEGTGDFGRSLSFLKELADTTGQDLFVLGDAYKGIYASAKQAGLATSEVNTIFKAVVDSGAALKLSNDKISLTLKAVEQMMNKGKIGAEELSQQLADHIPGAFAMMGKAAQDAGISLSGSTQELGKLMEDGKVASAVVLPFFAKRMEEAFGKNADANINTISGSANRLNNELTLLVDALDNGKVISFWATFQNSMADVFKDLTYYINSGSFKEFITHFGVNGGLSARRIKVEGEKSFALKSKPEQSTELKSLVNDLRYSNIALGRTLEDGTKIDQEYRKGLIDKIATYTKIFKTTKDATEKLTIPPSKPKDSDEAIKAIQDYTFEISLLDSETEKSLSNIQNLWEDIFRTQDAIFGGMDIKKISNIFAARGEQESLGEQLRKSFDITPLGDLLDESTKRLEEKASKLGERITSGFKSGLETSASINKKIFGDFILSLNESLNGAWDGLGETSFTKIKWFTDKLSSSFGMGMSESINTMMQMIDFASNSLADFFTESFSQIFNTEVKFDFKTVLGGFLKSFGQFVIAIGQKLLKAGILLALIPETATMGFRRIAAGVGLMALGGAISGGGGALSSNSQQTISPSENNSYQTQFKGAIGGSQGGFDGGKVVFELQGTTLRGVLNNTDKLHG